MEKRNGPMVNLSAEESDPEREPCSIHAWKTVCGESEHPEDSSLQQGNLGRCQSAFPSQGGRKAGK